MHNSFDRMSGLLRAISSRTPLPGDFPGDPIAEAGGAQSLETSPQAVAPVQQLGDGAHSSRSSNGVLLIPINVAIAKIARDHRPIFPHRRNAIKSGLLNRISDTKVTPSYGGAKKCTV